MNKAYLSIFPSLILLLNSVSYTEPKLFISSVPHSLSKPGHRACVCYHTEHTRSLCPRDPGFAGYVVMIYQIRKQSPSSHHFLPPKVISLLPMLSSSQFKALLIRAHTDAF